RLMWGILPCGAGMVLSRRRRGVGFQSCDGHSAQDWNPTPRRLHRGSSMPGKKPSRRAFLKAAGLASLSGSVVPASAAAPPADTPRELKPTGADLGSVFADVEKLADANHYAFSYLGDRFRTFDDFKTAARDKVHELL